MDALNPATTYGKQTLAHKAVAKARYEGLLQSPHGMKCADCGGAAIEYDHRDYDKPLVVEPVCRRCNIRRGPAMGHITQSTFKATKRQAEVI